MSSINTSSHSINLYIHTAMPQPARWHVVRFVCRRWHLIIFLAPVRTTKTPTKHTQRDRNSHNSQPYVGYTDSRIAYLCARCDAPQNRRFQSELAFGFQVKTHYRHLLRSSVIASKMHCVWCVCGAAHLVYSLSLRTAVAAYSIYIHVLTHVFLCVTTRNTPTTPPRTQHIIRR